MENYVFFDNYMIKTYEMNDETLFEVYSVGAALGYERWDGKTLKSDGTYRMFTYKSRIDNLINGLDIDLLEIDGKKYLDMAQLRTFIIGSNAARKNSFVDWLGDNYDMSTWDLYSISKEEIMLNALEEVLEPMGYTLQRQVKCGRYKIDAVIPELNLAIEYDENSHTGYNRRAEEIREAFIRLHYDLIRVSDSHKASHNIGLIIARIIEATTVI